MGQQRCEFDIEEPRGPDKKKPANQCLFYKYGAGEEGILTISLEERIYKLERDEAAFLQQIRNINTKQSTSVNQFFMKRSAGMSLGLPDDDAATLKSMIKKKKIYQRTEPIATTQVKVADLLPQQNAIFGLLHPLTFTMVASEPKVILQGLLSVYVSPFTQMPRGKAQVQIIGTSTFSLDENQAYEGLTFKLSKATGKDGESLTYHQSEEEVSKKAAKAVKFDTFFFDDSVKVQVFQKNSYVKSN
jgi:hypothetical protein